MNLAKTSILTPRAVFICFVGLLAAFFIYWARIYPGVLHDLLIREYSLDFTQFSIIAAAYTYAYLFGLLIAGVILDIFGCKRVLIIAIGITSTGLMLTSFFNTVNSLLIGRIVTGLCGAFTLIGILKLVGDGIPRKFFSIFIGIFFSIVILITTFGGPFISILGSTNFPVFLALLGILILLFVYFGSENISEIKDNVIKIRIDDIKNLARKRNIWLMVAIGVITSGANLFPFLFGVPYLTMHSGLSNAEASKAIIWLTVGMLFGAPISSFLSQLTLNKKFVLSISLLMSALSLFAAIFYATSYSSIVSTLFVFGFFSAAITVILYMIAHDSSSKVSFGTALSLYLFFTVLGGIFFGELLGLVSNQPSNSPLALSLIPVSLLIGCIFTFFISNKTTAADREMSKLHPVDYLKNAWKGTLGLGRSFWVVHTWGSLVYSFFTVFILILFALLKPISGGEMNFLLEFISLSTWFLFLCFPYAIFSAVVVWRCANNWEWWIGWKYIARVLVITGLISNASSLALCILRLFGG